MAEPQLATNNPFRRKTPVTAGAASPADSKAADIFDAPPPPPPPPAIPTGDQFREQLQALPKSAAAPPSTTFQKPKLVKKVRVQSPPPSSPDSTDADFEARFPRSGPGQVDGSGGSGSSGSDLSGDDDDDDEDPFETAADSEPAEDAQPSASKTTTITAPPRPPPNPFQKTLKDLEQPSRDVAAGGGASPGTPTGKGPLDVDAFRRLLLTGQAAAPAPQPQAQAQPPGHGTAAAAAAGDGGSMTDASSVSKQSIFDAVHAPQETPRTSHEISDADEDDQSGLIQGRTPAPPTPQRTTLRKKPPPPSSRHGKLIKIQLKTGSGGGGGGEPNNQSIYPSSKTGRPSSSSSSDLNKPLPPPPLGRSVDGESESIFDREAAGKIPEVDIDPDAPDEAIPPPRPPTPPNASHATSTPGSTKKPAPPPRRAAYPKPEGKPPSSLQNAAGAISPGPTAPADEPEAPARRASIESTRSRSSSIRLAIHAPAPPPPRRPNHASRPSNSFISPSAASFASSTSSPSALSDAATSPAAITTTLSPTVAAAREQQQPPPAQNLSPLGLAHSASLPKLSPSQPPPPPPPTRNASVRHKDGATASGRPPSVISLEATSRRVGRESSAVPPPPPPRGRGGSRGSMDGPSSSGGPAMGARRMSSDAVTAPVGGPAGGGIPSVVEEGEGEGEVLAPPSQAAGDILADLDALQREVDALRGRFEKSGEVEGGG